MTLDKERVSILTLNEVAWLLSTTPDMIWHWVKAGILNPYLNGKDPVFQRSDVATLLIKLGA